MKQVNNTLKWKDINFAKAKSVVRRLQHLKSKALEEGNNFEFQRLQHKLFNSFAGRVVAVWNVQSNAGSNTAGVDGLKLQDDNYKMEVVHGLKSMNTYKASDIRRVWIAKSGSSEKRPLGIPTIYDRCMQSLLALSADVFQEYNANPRSFGFRKGRSAAMAVSYIHLLSSWNGYRYVMKLDIKKFFDNINHSWLLANSRLPKVVLKSILTANIMEDGMTKVNVAGTPQGGPLSPILANITLNGIEEIGTLKGKTALIRYADDILILARDKCSFEKILPDLNKFLDIRGLSFNHNKTWIGEISDGFEFLGFEFKEFKYSAKYPQSKTRPGKNGNFLVQPSEKSIKKLKQNLRKIYKTHQKDTSFKLIEKLNPILRGWSNYFKYGNSTKVFNKIGFYLWSLNFQWVVSRHKNESIQKLMKKYFRMVLGNRWNLFGTKVWKNDPSKIKILPLFNIQSVLTERENVLKFEPSPNPYQQEHYGVFDKRLKRALKKSQLHIRAIKRLLTKQRFNCPICKTGFTYEYEVLKRTKNSVGEEVVVHKVCYGLSKKFRESSKSSV